MDEPSPSSSTDADVVAALSGKEIAFDDTAGVAEFIRRARFHGVELLLLRKSAILRSPASAALREMALAFAAWEMQHREAVATALLLLHKSGVPVLVFKGTALAASIYDDPAVRTRSDTDLLVAPGREPLATAVLSRAGFARVPGVASHQATFLSIGAGGTAHMLDVHWRINNSELLAGAFDFHELESRSLLLPRLGIGARGPSLVDSLLIACMHRATHKHYAYRVDGDAFHDPDRLIWLYDIHLLAGMLSGADWERLVNLAALKGLRAVVHEGLSRTREHFATALPDAVMQALNVDARSEAPSRYLAAGGLRRTWMDIRSMPGWSPRFRWLRDIAIPPADYIRAKYSASRSTCLACLYARRILDGLWKRVSART